MTSEIRPEDVKLPEPALVTGGGWAMNIGGVEVELSEWQPGAFKSKARNYYSADQVRAAVLAERERAAKVCDERAQECRDSFDSDRDERWLVYEKHAKRLAGAIRAGHSITETPLGEG